MQERKKHISIFIYILMAYTIIQFFWWTYLILELNAEIIWLEKLVVLFGDDSLEAQNILGQGNLDTVFFKKKMMILGEGGVFLSILLIGFYLINRSHKKELELAEQEQNFMLAVTHELNSPLAAIKLNVETLRKRKLSEEKVAMVLNRTFEESERLNFLVNNILATARMEQRGFELFPEQIDLSAHLAGLVHKYQQSLPQNITSFISEGVHASIDILGFDLIFQNLIENASKYSPDDQKIEVHLLQNHDQKIELKIADYGIGIPDEEKKKVFHKFYRVGNEGTRKSKGTGIGLYLVHTLVKEMNGEIRLTNNEPMGSTFRLILPH